MKIRVTLNINCNNQKAARKLADVLEGEIPVQRLPQNEIFVEGFLPMETLGILMNTLRGNKGVSGILRRSYFAGDYRTVYSWVRAE